jgi:hypothetical protein
MYTSKKVMQVCVMTALKVKRYKRKKYSFVIILDIHVVRLIQIQSHVTDPLKTRIEHAVPLHATKGSEKKPINKNNSSMVHVTVHIFGIGLYQGHRQGFAQNMI